MTTVAFPSPFLGADRHRFRLFQRSGVAKSEKEKHSLEHAVAVVRQKLSTASRSCGPLTVSRIPVIS